MPPSTRQSREEEDEENTPSGSPAFVSSRKFSKLSGKKLFPFSRMPPHSASHAGRETETKFMGTEHQKLHSLYFLDPWQGCQICLGPKYQNGEKYAKLPHNISNGNKLFPMAVK
jgi:hypothetical protein